MLLVMRREKKDWWKAQKISWLKSPSPCPLGMKEEKKNYFPPLT